MSTIDRTALVAGQRLDRVTFHERYEGMPPGTRAELIGGVVHMPSPLRGDHGKVSRLISGWLLHYQRFTRGVLGADNASTLLDDEAEPQPDASLFIRPELGGRTRLEDGFIAGAPELIVEVARSSRRIDLGPKHVDYERAGVLEYLVVALDPDEVFWHFRRDERFTLMAPAPDGVHRSEVFPGLWLDARALFAEDLDPLFATLDAGLASPEHAAFVAGLAARRVDP
ncbi:MAG: Uma2 family endonuclease [Singulisphaera sp.]|nr:Uma2 family endonuclease [Singulisphaera sp.]